MSNYAGEAKTSFHVALSVGRATRPSLPPMKRRKRLARPRPPRNPLVLAAAQRKAGPHGPSEKAQRRRARVALKKGEE